MPNQTYDYGNLRVTLTKEFNWVWSDSGAGGSRDISVFHAKPQGDLRPLGSFATPGYHDPNNQRATILVGNAPSGSMNAAVASPTGYTQIWTDRGSKGSHDGSFWRPTAPSGYVALGDVCSPGWHTPSNNAIWCVRSDLALQSDYKPDSLWSDSGSGADADCTVWSIVSPPGTADGSEKVPVLLDLFIANGSYGKPAFSRAKALALPCPKNFARFSADLPTFTKNTIPREGDVISEMSQCAVTLPFTAFFSPTDSASLNRIEHPFVKLERRTAWYVEDVSRNASDQPALFKTEVTKGVSTTQSEEMSHTVGVSITTTGGIKAIGGSVEVALNYQFTSTQSYSTNEYTETKKSREFTVGPWTAIVLLTNRAFIQATRTDGSTSLHQIGFNATDDVDRGDIQLR